MALNLFEFLEQFLLDTFLIKIPQFEKSDNQILFSKLEFDHVFRDLYNFAIR